MATAHKRDNAPQRRPSTASTLAALTYDYLEELEIDGRSALTAKRYSAYLTTFLEWLAFRARGSVDSLTPGDVTDERLREYRLFLSRRRGARTGRPVGPGTRNLYSIVLRNLLKYCRRRGYAVPEANETLPLAKERDVEIRHLERDEVERLRHAVDLTKPTGLRDRAVIEMLFGSAVRVSELAALTARQVDLARREVQVIGKGGRSRLVLLTEDAAGWVERYLASRSDEHPSLFVVTKAHEPRALSVRQIQRIVDVSSQRAGLPFRVSPHWLRHSRLTVLARFSDVTVAQRIAGHSSLATTSRYLHVSDPHLRKAFDEAERADRGET